MRLELNGKDTRGQQSHVTFTVIAGRIVVVIVTVNPANHRHKVSNETRNFALHHDTVAANRIHIVSIGFVRLNHNWKHYIYLTSFDQQDKDFLKVLILEMWQINLRDL